MITLLLAICALIATMCALLLCLEELADDTKVICVVSLICSSVVIGMVFMHITHKIFPSALDVYKGKTEMKVNYSVIGNDTIVNDTTVVFKK